ncbi:transcriptional regulator, MarR family [Chthoniobacter flavus Ellin428]|uniref:Transcriptional regulator, MarR family n=1 Tax=Chthoniobacter flavus Ellin428 TaxID=497964 RepID=B4CV09_9BACT|nr:MarR family transcriptional regulator [Chthoniobacter flavus]EDY22397.1 transcriptional regulator, MarR family [Chthoniobacter flavus Ellin428]
MMRKRFSPPASSSVPAIPRPGEGKRGEAGHVGYLLRQAHAIHRLRMERALADLDVTPPQFAVLTMLNAYPGISNADVARLSLLTPQTVSVIVTNLEKMGAIARRPHSIHGRIQHLDVTEAGQKLLTLCRTRVQKIEAWLLEGLTAAEENAVRRWLGEIALRQELEEQK